MLIRQFSQRADGCQKLGGEQVAESFDMILCLIEPGRNQCKAGMADLVRQREAFPFD